MDWQEKWASARLLIEDIRKKRAEQEALLSQLEQFCELAALGIDPDDVVRVESRGTLCVRYRVAILKGGSEERLP